MKKKSLKKKPEKRTISIQKENGNKSDRGVNIKEILSFNNRQIFKYSFWILFPLVSLSILLSSITVGIPADEPIDATYGKEAIDFYTSLGQDTSFLNLTVYDKIFNLQKYYGAGFEMPAMVMSKLVSGRNVFKLRHIMTALCGVIMLLFLGLMSKELVGWFAGSIALLFAAASPTFVGHMLFNSKDIPFALGFTIAIFFIMKLAKSLPSVPFLNLLGLTAGIAIATSIRIGGILIIFYLVVSVVAKFVFESDFRTKFQSQPRKVRFISLASLGVTSALGTLLGLLSYPNFFLYPLQHFRKALTVASDFPVKILMLFEGKMIYSTDIPSYYLAKSLVITLPIFILISTLLAILFSRRIIKVMGKTKFIILLLTVLFPVIYVTWSHAAIYNGWRHILFFYPSLLVLCSCAIAIVLSPYKKDLPRTSLTLLFTFLIMKVLIWQANNHRYQYTYYNEIAGGCYKAFEKYDSDYQQLGTSTGLDWLLNNDSVLNDTSRNRLIIASNNANALRYYYDTAAINIEFISTGFKELRDRNWDYAVMSTLFVSPDIIKTTFPPVDVVHELNVADKPITYIMKRKSKDDYYGLEALRKSDFNQAVQLLLNANRQDPRNYNVWLHLAQGYSVFGNGREIIKYAYPYIQLYPSDWAGHHVLGRGYLYEKDYPNSEKFLTNAMTLNPSAREIYNDLLTLYINTGETEKASKIRDQLSNM